MNFGTGDSHNTARLRALIDDDSGYGGSMGDDASFAGGWNPGMTEDRYTPVSTPGRAGEVDASSTSTSATRHTAVLTLHV